MKKPIFISVLIIVVLAAAAMVLFGILKNTHPVIVKASLDRRSAHIGDPVVLTFIIDAERAVDIVESPAVKELLEKSGFTVIKAGSAERPALRGQIIQERYIFTTYKTGEYVVPSFVLKYRVPGNGTPVEAGSAELKLDVESLLPKGETYKKEKVKVGGGLVGEAVSGAGTAGEEGESPREREGLVRFKISETTGLKDLPKFKRIMATIGIIIAVMPVTPFVIMYFWIMKMRKKRALSPYEFAVEELKGLKGKDLPKKGKYKEFCAGLYAAMIPYIRSRYGIKSGEMTTEEFLRVIDTIEELDEEQKKYLDGLLKACDLVKYSIFSPEGAGAVLDVDAAIKFVEGTRKVKEMVK